MNFFSYIFITIARYKGLSENFEDIPNRDTLIIKYGYLGRNNKYVITPNLQMKISKNELSQYSSLLVFLDYKLCFSSGLAVFQNEKGLYGFINKKGKIIIECIYSDAQAFSEGKAAVKAPSTKTEDLIKVQGDPDAFYQALIKRNLWGCIDTKGRTIIDFKYFKLDKYRRGRTYGVISNYFEDGGKIEGTIKKDKNENVTLDESTARISDNLMRGISWSTLLIDENGLAIGAPLSQMYQYYAFSEDDIACALPNELAHFFGMGARFIDRNGSFLNFKRDEDDWGDSREMTYYNIPSTKRYQIQPFPEDIPLLEITKFSKGYAAGKFDQDKWVFFNTDLIICGKSSETMVYEDAGPFSNNERAYVKINGKYGYIDTHFNLVIPCQYDNVENFVGALARVQIIQNGVTINSYINDTGKVVWQNIEYEPISKLISQ